MWRSKPSPQRTWLQRWKRVSWMQHLCGRILRRSQHGHFVDAWTSSVLDSRVNHSVQPEKEKPTTIPGTCGRMSDKQSDLFDHGWLCLKTSKESSAANLKEGTGTTQRGHQYCSMSLESWKEQVTAVRGEYSQRVKSVLPTNGSGSSSLGWMTLEAANSDGYQISGGKKILRLGSQVADQKNWPTPLEDDSSNVNPSAKRRTSLVKEANIHAGPPAQEKSSTSGKNHGSPKLNPNWVEQLMGLPIGWTDFDFSETESCQQPAKEL